MSVVWIDTDSSIELIEAALLTLGVGKQSAVHFVSKTNDWPVVELTLDPKTIKALNNAKFHHWQKPTREFIVARSQTDQDQFLKVGASLARAFEVPQHFVRMADRETPQIVLVTDKGDVDGITTLSTVGAVVTFTADPAPPNLGDLFASFFPPSQ